jgi:hypothetical protein
MSEVQEQVLKYLPVMARPLVMSQNRQVMWTGVYADMAVSRLYQIWRSLSLKARLI